MLKTNNKEINVLFFGDIFGDPGIEVVSRHIKDLKQKYKADFVIAQAENVSGRKGFKPRDYKKLKEIGIDAFTLGNHVWAHSEIEEIIENNDVIRPANINDTYPGQGYREFIVKDQKIGVCSMMGIQFNILLSPWKEEQANSFFDEFDKIQSMNQPDYLIIDFHAETTSEKNVFGLYVDGKADALFGTHTHVQTNDARILPNGTYYCTDAGMCGPYNSAIGANYDEVYGKMRYNAKAPFRVSENKCQINGIYFKLTKDNQNKQIELIKIYE
ncbi:TIGR00282 family metallophosphoesterase [Mycoplasma phocoenae]|uniref:YmdB family metallophosphoesterase n=1 Tax=Mycoplasma phocoenae TaxID=754517 RepID=A0A858U6S9_9MOLU|nr:TIGR00282 family metallophosphoesterase [Mycoplasma phocoenae]QJG67157.1 YmdB family metallophosphoesterase [Mycoplasma phocoenae]